MFNIITFWWVAALTVLISLGVIIDEDPIFEISDLSVLNVVFLVTCLCIVFWDSVIRGGRGFWGYKDRQVWVGAWLYFTWLLNYHRLIGIVFSVHYLLPLELDLAEGSSLVLTTSPLVAQFLGLWFGACWFGLSLVHLLRMAVSLGSGRSALARIFLALAGVSLALVMWFQLWALMGISNVAEVGLGSVRGHYGSRKTNLVYGPRGVDLGDPDWHARRGHGFSPRAESLLILLLGLLGVIEMVVLQIGILVVVVGGARLSHNQWFISWLDLALRNLTWVGILGSLVFAGVAIRFGVELALF